MRSRDVLRLEVPPGAAAQVRPNRRSQHQPAPAASKPSQQRQPAPGSSSTCSSQAQTEPVLLARTTTPSRRLPFPGCRARFVEPGSMSCITVCITVCITRPGVPPR